MMKGLAIPVTLCAMAGPADAGYTWFVNGSPGAPSLDLLADGQRLFSGAEYGVPPQWPDFEYLGGPHSFEAVPAGGGDPLAQADFDLDDDYTIAAAGPADNMELLFFRNSGWGHGVMSLRFVNLSPDAPAIDLVKGPHVLFEGVGYKQSGGYESFAKGEYDFEFRDSASGEVLLELPDVHLTKSAVTVWLMGYAGGQEPGLQAMVTLERIPAPGTVAVAALTGLLATRWRR
jgi:hypothetical protein